MKASFFKRAETELPEIEEFSLLTYEDFEKYQENIPAPMIFTDLVDSNVWYLRDTGGIESDADGEEVTDSDVLLSVGTGEVVKSAPNEYDCCVFKYEELWGYGIRPAIYFAASLAEAGLVPGDQFKIADYLFTVIADKIALCDIIIDYDVFDLISDNGNPSADYRNSSIKKSINQWGKQLVD